MKHHPAAPWLSLVTRRLALTMDARVGLAPTPCGLTNRRATLTPPGNGAADRTHTCIVPFRTRMPNGKLVAGVGVTPSLRSL
jgi:hypothetical protein